MVMLNLTKGIANLVIIHSYHYNYICYCNMFLEDLKFRSKYSFCNIKIGSNYSSMMYSV